MIGISFTTATLAARKRIALVAHDHCKVFARLGRTPQSDPQPT